MVLGGLTPLGALTPFSLFFLPKEKRLKDMAIYWTTNATKRQTFHEVIIWVGISSTTHARGGVRLTFREAWGWDIHTRE